MENRRILSKDSNLQLLKKRSDAQGKLRYNINSLRVSVSELLEYGR